MVVGDGEDQIVLTERRKGNKWRENCKSKKNKEGCLKSTFGAQKTAAQKNALIIAAPSSMDSWTDTALQFGFISRAGILLLYLDFKATTRYSSVGLRRLDHYLGNEHKSITHYSG